MRGCYPDYLMPKPAQYRFPVPNSVWSLALKPKPFSLLCFLFFHQKHGDGTMLTATAIAGQVHMSVRVVKKNLTLLCAMGLITKDHTLSAEKDKLQGQYFTLPNEIFMLKISPGALCVYAFLLYCENRQTRKCHPSYKTICAHTGMSIATAERCVSELVEAQLIAVERTTYFRRNCKRVGNNEYIILPVWKATELCYQKQLALLEQQAAQVRIQRKLKAYDSMHTDPAA